MGILRIRISLIIPASIGAIEDYLVQLFAEAGLGSVYGSCGYYIQYCLTAQSPHYVGLTDHLYENYDYYHYIEQGQAIQEAVARLERKA